ncbi:MAG: hypothetical protein U9Q20_05795 [Campylobacterota bacterium]|nr:hypothetical protein [Campylobacterota bacterium]
MIKNIIKSSLLGLTLLPIIAMADMDRCVSCHGVDFEKKALGYSKVVKGMSEKEIKASLDGYLNGQGGDMKELMMVEVNVGVDTNAMAVDVYSETITAGFEEPNDEFIFQKRFSVKTLHKLKQMIKKADKKDMPKVISQIKSIAFDLYTYDDLLKDKFDFKTAQANRSKLTKKDILSRVVKVKKCVDHSFSEEQIVKCRIDFMNLATSLTKDQERRIKNKMKKPPIYTGEGAVDISKYIK